MLNRFNKVLKMCLQHLGNTNKFYSTDSSQNNQGPITSLNEKETLKNSPKNEVVKWSK